MRDKMATDENEAADQEVDSHKLAARPRQILKRIRWKFLIYIDRIEDAPKEVTSDNEAHFCISSIVTAE